MARLYLIAGIAALALFTWGQVRGVGLFDDEANPSQTRLAPGQRATFHK